MLLVWKIALSINSLSAITQYEITVSLMIRNIFPSTKHLSYFKECRLIAEQTLLSKTSDRYSLSSIGLDPAACHLSHLNGPRRDLPVASELHTLLAWTQSNARSAFGGRSSGSHWGALVHGEGQLLWPLTPEPWPSFTSRSPLQQLHLHRVS